MIPIIKYYSIRTDTTRILYIVITFSHFTLKMGDKEIYLNSDDEYKPFINKELESEISDLPVPVSEEDEACILDTKLERTSRMCHRQKFRKENIHCPEIGQHLDREFSHCYRGDIDEEILKFSQDKKGKFRLVFPDFDDRSAPTLLKQKLIDRLVAMANPSGCVVAVTVSKRCGAGKKHGRCVGHLKQQFARKCKEMNKKGRFVKSISSHLHRKKRGGCPVDTLIFRVGE